MPLYLIEDGHKAFSNKMWTTISNHMRPCVPITLQHVNVHTMESVVGNILDFSLIWVSKLIKDVPI